MDWNDQTSRNNGMKAYMTVGVGEDINGGVSKIIRSMPR